MQARPADAFVDSIGVNVHTAFSDTPYVSEFAAVKQRLAELGVRHVRDVLFPARPDQYQRLDELAAAGVGSTLVIGSPAEPPGTMADLLEVAADEIDGVEALEGPNEYSTSGDPEWKAHLIAYQQALYEQAKDDPDLAALPVIGPSIVHGDQAELGYIAPILDFGNIHSYSQGNPPDALGPFISRATLNSGDKPIWATETGYHTALGWTGENPPVPEAAMATYMPRLFFEYARWGILRTFSYELLDEQPDPGGADKEDHFGLLRNDLSPKPAFDALRNTISIVADPGAPFAPGPLDLRLSEGGVELPADESTNLHHLLLQKRDGSFYLALWRTSSVWSVAMGEPLPAQPSPVELRVGPGLETATEYLPNSSAAPVWSLTRPAQPLQVEVGPEVVILRLIPGAAAPEEPAGPGPSQPQGGTSTGSGGQQGGSRDGGAGPEPGEPPICVVPRLLDRKLSAARAQLRRAHCKLGEVRGPRTAASRVLAQQPRAQRRLAAGAEVDVKLGSR